MRYNLYAWFLFVVTFLNYSIDLIQHDRFRKEREAIIRKDRNGATCSQGLDDHRHGHRPTFLENLRHAIEYNELGFWAIIVYITHIIVLILLNLMTTFYAFYPHPPQPKSNSQAQQQFTESQSSYIDFIYMFDALHFFKRSQHYNWALMVIVLQYLFIKLENSRRIYQTSQANRHHYKRLNVVQLDFAYLSRMRMNTKGWLTMVFTLGRHKCRLETSLHRDADKDGDTKAKRIKFHQLAAVDRLYYYNMLDFDDCFQGYDIVEPHHHTNSLKTYSQLTWFEWFKCRYTPAHRFLLSDPVHRVDRTELSILTYLGMQAVILMNGAALMGFLYLSWLFLRYHSALEELPANILTTPKLFIGINMIFTLFLTILSDVADNGPLIVCATFWSSRARKIKNMLRYENKQCRKHLLAFHKHLSERHVQVCEELLVVQEDAEDERLSGHETPFSFRHQQGAKDGFKDEQHDKPGAYELLVEQYRIHKVEASQLSQLNENLNYLLDLIMHLKREQEDIKSFFTFRLNINVLFGVLALIIALSEWFKAELLEEMLVILLFVIIVLFPMSLALILGATAELQSRQICRTLNPIMANELGLVDVRVIRRMQEIHHFLSIAKNRGFVLLGSLSLDFSSLVTIFGSIASAFLLQEKRERLALRV